MDDKLSTDFLTNKLSDKELTDFIISFLDYDSELDLLNNYSLKRKLKLKEEIYEFLPKVDFENKVKKILNNEDGLDDLKIDALKLFVSD